MYCGVYWHLLYDIKKKCKYEMLTLYRAQWFAELFVALNAIRISIIYIYYRCKFSTLDLAPLQSTRIHE